MDMTDDLNDDVLLQGGDDFENEEFDDDVDEDALLGSGDEYEHTDDMEGGDYGLGVAADTGLDDLPTSRGDYDDDDDEEEEEEREERSRFRSERKAIEAPPHSNNDNNNAASGRNNSNDNDDQRTGRSNIPDSLDQVVCSKSELAVVEAANVADAARKNRRGGNFMNNRRGGHAMRGQQQHRGGMQNMMRNNRSLMGAPSGQQGAGRFRSPVPFPSPGSPHFNNRQQNAPNYRGPPPPNMGPPSFVPPVPFQSFPLPPHSSSHPPFAPSPQTHNNIDPWERKPKIFVNREFQQRNLQQQQQHQREQIEREVVAAALVSAVAQHAVAAQGGNSFQNFHSKTSAPEFLLPPSGPIQQPMTGQGTSLFGLPPSVQPWNQRFQEQFSQPPPNTGFRNDFSRPPPLAPPMNRPPLMHRPPAPPTNFDRNSAPPPQGQFGRGRPPATMSGYGSDRSPSGMMQQQHQQQQQHQRDGSMRRSGGMAGRLGNHPTKRSAPPLSSGSTTPFSYGNGNNSSPPKRLTTVTSNASLSPMTCSNDTSRNVNLSVLKELPKMERRTLVNAAKRKKKKKGGMMNQGVFIAVSSAQMSSTNNLVTPAIGSTAVVAPPPPVDETPEDRELRLKLEEQKLIRERFIKLKEERRKLAAMEKQKKLLQEKLEAASATSVSSTVTSTVVPSVVSGITTTVRSRQPIVAVTAPAVQAPTPASRHIAPSVRPTLRTGPTGVMPPITSATIVISGTTTTATTVMATTGNKIIKLNTGSATGNGKLPQTGSVGGGDAGNTTKTTAATTTPVNPLLATALKEHRMQCSVVISNLSSSTSQVTLKKMAAAFGQVQLINVNTEKRIALIRFALPEQAVKFKNRYHRFMLDLSLIQVRLRSDIAANAQRAAPTANATAST